MYTVFMEDMTITGTYQGNYKQTLSGTGREVRISDGVIGYCYDLADGDSLQDALDSFSESYDFARDHGDHSQIEVEVEAELYVDGEVEDRATSTLVSVEQPCDKHQRVN